MQWRALVRLKARNLTLAVALAMAVGVLSVNGYWFVRGVDVQRHTLDLARSIGAGTWTTILAALSRLALAVVALLVVSRIARRLLRAAQPWLNRWDQLGDNNRSLGTLFAGLEGAVVNIVKSAVLAPIPQRKNEEGGRGKARLPFEQTHRLAQVMGPHAALVDEIRGAVGRRG